jgi:16S rRNA (uracil1498-N3)-methyltransferase
MPRFFVSAGALAAGRARITGADATHLARSLRARPGEEVVVVDEAGIEHGVHLDAVSPEGCEGVVAWSRPSSAEPRLRVTVLQAIPQQAMEDAIEAMVQAGVSRILPVVTARSVVRLDPERAARRLERWRAVAREAAGLAQRGAVPAIGDVLSLSAALEARDPSHRLLAADPQARTPAASLVIAAGVPVTVVIGPEGGLDVAELDLLAAAGAERIHLGPRVLRARLAGALATALLLAGAGDLGRGVAPPPP